MEELLSGYASMASYSRTLSNLTMVDQIVEDTATVTVTERVIYQQAGPDLQEIGCFRVYQDKKTGAIVQLPIACPTDKQKPPVKKA